jgi:tetratricopeptide (TPR) repeat protein
VEDNSGTHRLLSYCYVLQREFDRALAEEDIIRSAGPSGNEFTGDILAFKDDIGAAETVYRKIYETNRDLGLDRFLRLDLIRGRYAEAIDFLQKYFSASNEETIIATNVDFIIGAVLEKAGRYEEASQIYDRYFKLRADHRKSAPESSLPYLPSDQKFDLFTKARIQTEMKNWNGAAKAAEELKGEIAKGISVNELPFYDYVLGFIELGKKNPRKAAVYFEKACGRLYSEFFPVVELGQNGDQALFLNGLALALFQAGDLDRARTAYERITRLTIGRWDAGDIYSKAFYMLGKIAEQQGDKPRAGENFRKFLDLWKDADPGLPEVEDARKRLAGLTGS